MEIYPPTFAKRWGIKKIPPSPGPRGPWDKRKKFSRARSARKIFFAVGCGGITKKIFFGGDSKNQSTSHPHTLSTYTHQPPRTLATPRPTLFLTTQTHQPLRKSTSTNTHLAPTGHPHPLNTYGCLVCVGGQHSGWLVCLGGESFGWLVCVCQPSNKVIPKASLFEDKSHMAEN